MHTGLVFRSTDLKTRVRVDIRPSYDEVRPYQLSFYNLAAGDRHGSAPVELQHGDSGYIWIEEGMLLFFSFSNSSRNL
jgi:hypothetical protein